MSQRYKTFLLLVIVVSLFFAVVSGHEIAIGNAMKLDPSYWRFGYLYNAFVWMDLFVFSLLWAVIGGVLLYFKRPIYFLLALSCFWFIRTLGETFYWFLQQFNPDFVPWQQYFIKFWFLNQLSDKQFWVLNQIFNQSLAVLSLFGIFYSLMKIVKKANE